MALNTSNRTGEPAGGEGCPPQPLAWASFGLSEVWVNSRLAPLCRQCPQLERGSAPDSSAALERGEGLWDILFVGDGRGARVTGESPLAALVGAIHRRRPLDCVVAVVPGATAEEQGVLLRAGACDVIALDAEQAHVQGVLGRMQARRHARREFWEREMLRLTAQLAISVNHEINNPLTGLMGTTELLLLEGRGLGEKMKRDLNTIIKQCHRIQEVTARLKNLKRLRVVPYGSHDTMIDLIGDLQPAPAPQPAPPLEQFLPAPRVLVVDDNPLIIDLIARLFEQRFAIDAAGCASEALARVEERGYDLILIDLILPEMNGLELFRAIRRLKPQQKAMLTTAYEGDARVEQAIAEGALGCIYKPFQLEDLEAALLDAIRGKTGY